MVSMPMPENDEQRLVEEFLRDHGPSHEIWQQGRWLRVLAEGATEPELDQAYRRLLLHAAIAVRRAADAAADAGIRLPASITDGEIIEAIRMMEST